MSELGAARPNHSFAHAAVYIYYLLYVASRRLARLVIKMYYH
jgi:hypothetical protein